MTNLVPRVLPTPSPHKSNPFARPSSSTTETRAFSRTALLPTLASPAKTQLQNDPLSTPADKATVARSATGSARARQSWRLLWRGGLEIGKDGWRLEGVTFYALLSFPSTPSGQSTNPFDAPIQKFQTEGSTTPNAPSLSPFPLPAGDTDLCLSLESMRGRKHLQVRGLIDLPAEETLDGGDEAGVQMSISPKSPLLAAYFTGLLCRNPTLSPQGRTLNAVVIGLGDEDVDTGSTILVFGQRQVTSEGVSLRLCAARRRASTVPSERKVRPGEPLPRAPLFFPDPNSKRPPVPFPRRSGTGSKPFTRAPSVQSIYQHPQVSVPLPPPAPISGRTPGRRGEKRPRLVHEHGEEKRRKSGRIVLVREVETVEEAQESQHATTSVKEEVKARPPAAPPDEDIFGKHLAGIIPTDMTDPPNGEEDADSLSKSRRPKVPQQILDNKASIRKHTMLLMEERGCGRNHDIFRDVFGMSTKGTYFALRNRLESGPLDKIDIQSIINGHLDMYLPTINTSPLAPASAPVADTEEGSLTVQQE